MLKKQYTNLILIPLLKLCNFYSVDALHLMLGTLICETNFEFLKQEGGPALGIYQIEPSTYAAICKYLNRSDNRPMRDRILAGCFYDNFPTENALTSNLALNTLIARTKYFMIPEQLPNFKDIQGQAKYYKNYYNTAFGEGSLDRYVSLYTKFITEYI